MVVETPRGVEPYTIDIDDEVLVDLRRRLAATRWPDEIDGIGWNQGTNLAYVRELVRYWHDEFDWRTAERTLNELPHYHAEVDGLDIHFIHARGRGPNPYPLVITHGPLLPAHALTGGAPFLPKQGSDGGGLPGDLPP